MQCATSNGQAWRCAAEADDGHRMCAKHRDAARSYAADYLSRMSPSQRTRYNRDRQLRQLYGITMSRYEELLTLQDGVCAICHQAETHKKRGVVCGLSVDHDHETGEVRGLLCNNCNRGLGFLRDDAALLLAAAGYLNQGVVS